MLILLRVIVFVDIVEKVHNAFLSAGKGSWSQSGDMCEDNPAGGSLFQECQPGTCKPELLKGTITGLTDHEATMWINGYVLRSFTMQYYGVHACVNGGDTLTNFTSTSFNNIHEDDYEIGCYGIAKTLKSSTIQALTYKENITDNNVLQCSNFCSPHGKFILLMDNWCYCLSKKLKQNWKNLFVTFDEVSTSLCNFRCPGDDNYYCGRRENPDENTIHLSVYEYQPIKPDPIFVELGLHCFYVERQGNYRNVKYTNCNEQRKFKCQEVQQTGGDKKWNTTCFHLLLNWYEARSKCQSTETFLQAYAPSKKLCDNNKGEDLNDTWHNRFIVEKIIWKTDGYPNQNPDNCLAMKKTVDGNFKLLTSNCNEEYPALCEINDATTVKSEPPIMSTHTSTHDQPESTDLNIYSSQSSSSSMRVVATSDIAHGTADGLTGSGIGGIIAAVVTALLLVFLLSAFIIRRKRYFKQNEVTVNQDPYYATASNTVLLEGKPDTPEYMYVHNIEVNLPGDNTVDDYNHLGDAVSNEIKPSPVYDHAEGQENEYNLTASSQRREDINFVHNIYDDSREVENVYDKTSTVPTKPNNTHESLLIYDHERQSENNYDVTNSYRKRDENNMDDSVYDHA